MKKNSFALWDEPVSSNDNLCTPILGAVLMAASESSEHFGSNKLLSDFKGKPLFAHGMSALRIPQIQKPLVVTRYDEIAIYCMDERFPCITHCGPAHSDTIMHGISALFDTDGCLFLQADMPLITQKALKQLIQTFIEHPDAICQLTGPDAQVGPAIFPSSLYRELAELSGEAGGSAVMRQHPEMVLQVPIDQSELFFNIDTPEDLERLAAL